MTIERNSELVEAAREAILSQRPELVNLILPACSAFVRAELVIQMHQREHGKIPAIKTVRNLAMVGYATAQAAVAVARNRERRAKNQATS
jgi:ribosomal protein L7/L12